MFRLTALVKLTLVNLLLVVSIHADGILRFDNGHWYDGSGFTQRTMWSVDGILRDSFAGKPDEIVDLKDAWVIPPFADAHHHALADTSRFVAAGIFYVKNPNNPASAVAALREKVNQPLSVDVVFSNGGLTSTGGHP